ncbi:acyltransferase [Robertmurraya korlensis]|uniref:acyltransferase family protein n=1 Tax=Robertmurraya korlensis TaxID=519977 RepID=UPI00203B1E97|nr:acyltransferase [Robertmurraya korlensis]MCM3599409.1 acyltransferase [Robertmurraya korlensis]
MGITDKNTIFTSNKISKYVSKKITILSFLYAYLVVVIHSSNSINYFGTDKSINFVTYIENIIGEGVARIAVPSFFVISGILFFIGFTPSINAFRSKYKSRAKSLLVPYLLWNVIGYVYACIVPLLAAKVISINTLPAEIGLKSFLIAVITAQYTTFWFIGSLIICVVLSPVIYFLVSKPIFSEISIVLLAVIWGVFAGRTGILVGLFFFSLGAYIILRLPNLINKKMTLKQTWVLIVAFIGVLLLNAYFYPTELVKMVILLGIPTVWVLYDLFETKIKVTEFMKYSFVIFAAHSFVNQIILKTILVVLGKGQIQAMFNYIVTPFLSVVLVIIAGSLVRKYLPKIWSLLNGGRNA